MSFRNSSKKKKKKDDERMPEQLLPRMEEPPYPLQINTQHQYDQFAYHPRAMSPQIFYAPDGTQFVQSLPSQSSQVAIAYGPGPMPPGPFILSNSPAPLPMVQMYGGDVPGNPIQQPIRQTQAQLQHQMMAGGGQYQQQYQHQMPNYPPPPPLPPPPNMAAPMLTPVLSEHSCPTGSSASVVNVNMESPRPPSLPPSFNAQNDQMKEGNNPPDGSDAQPLNDDAPLEEQKEGTTEEPGETVEEIHQDYRGREQKKKRKGLKGLFKPHKKPNNRPEFIPVPPPQINETVEVTPKVVKPPSSIDEEEEDAVPQEPNPESALAEQPTKKSLHGSMASFHSMAPTESKNVDDSSANLFGRIFFCCNRKSSSKQDEEEVEPIYGKGIQDDSLSEQMVKKDYYGTI